MPGWFDDEVAHALKDDTFRLEVPDLPVLKPEILQRVTAHPSIHGRLQQNWQEPEDPDEDLEYDYESDKFYGRRLLDLFLLEFVREKYPRLVSNAVSTLCEPITSVVTLAKISKVLGLPHYLRVAGPDAVALQKNELVHGDLFLAFLSGIHRSSDDKDSYAQVKAFTRVIFQPLIDVEYAMLEKRWNDQLSLFAGDASIPAEEPASVTVQPDSDEEDIDSDDDEEKRSVVTATATTKQPANGFVTNDTATLPSAAIPTSELPFRPVFGPPLPGQEWVPRPATGSHRIPAPASSSTTAGTSASTSSSVTVASTSTSAGAPQLTPGANYVGRLMEWAAGTTHKIEYVDSRDGPSHAPSFYCTVIIDGQEAGKGTGATKKAAKHDASGRAAIKLGLLR